jgi:hypothetical protein
MPVKKRFLPLARSSHNSLMDKYVPNGPDLI